MGYAMILSSGQQQVMSQQYANQAKAEAAAAKNWKPPLKQDKGDLAIVDSFTPSSNSSETPHGTIIQATVKREGFQGKTVTRETDMDDNSESHLEADQDQMFQAGASPDDFKAAIRDHATHMQTGLLNDRANQLNGLATDGMHDGAVNLSSSGSKAGLVNNLYQNATWNPDPKEVSPDAVAAEKTLQTNYGKAFNFNPADLQDQGEKGQAARAKLQQGLIDQVNQGIDGNQEVAKAKQGYDKAVGNLAQKNVSVVVAGGNDGTDAADWNLANGGKKLNTGADFYANPLSNSNTVTVGAVGDLRHQSTPGAVADYNSPVKDTIMANGITQDPNNGGEPEEGTSFAAPRVAAALAKIHGQHPGMSNAAALAMLKKNDTDAVAGAPAPVVLDDSKAKQLLAAH